MGEKVVLGALSRGVEGALVLALVLYLLSPLDLIPESAFGLIGLLDDGLVLAFVLVALLAAFRQHLVARRL